MVLYRRSLLSPFFKDKNYIVTPQKIIILHCNPTSRCIPAFPIDPKMTCTAFSLNQGPVGIRTRSCMSPPSCRHPVTPASARGIDLRTGQLSRALPGLGVSALWGTAQASSGPDSPAAAPRLREAPGCAGGAPAATAGRSCGGRGSCKPLSFALAPFSDDPARRKESWGRRVLAILRVLLCATAPSVRNRGELQPPDLS